MQIMNIFLCARAMGSFEPEITAPLRHYLSREQSAYARRAKGIVTAERKSKLEEAIAAEAKQNRVLSASVEFAELIRPGVRERLGRAKAGSVIPPRAL